MIQAALGHTDIKKMRNYAHVKNQNLRDQFDNLPAATNL